jgi:hypothetical protein
MIKKDNIKETIGIYIDINDIAISVATLNKDKINVNKTVHVPTNFKPEGIVKPLSLNNDFFSEKQSWVTAFKDAIKKSNLKSNSAVVSLSHDFSITRFFAMPYIDRKFWNKAIPIESKKYIPVSFDELGYDFYAYQMSDRSKIGVAFSVTQKKTTEFLVQQLKNLGIKLELVEPSAFAAIRFFHTVTKVFEPSIFIYSSDDDIYTVLTYENIPIMFRCLSFSKSSSFSERRTLDLKGSILFAQRMIPNMDVKKVFVFEGIPELWIKNIEMDVGIKPEVVKLSDKIVSPDFSFSTILSISSSIKNQTKEQYSIDISEIEKSKRFDKIVMKNISIIAGVISSLFLLSFLINTIRIHFISKDISQYMVQMPEVVEFKNLTADETNKKIEKMKKSRDIFNRILIKRDYVSSRLSDLADIIPKDLWIKEFIYSNPFMLNPDSGIQISLSMNGETLLTGDARTYYIEYFVKEIRKSKSFYICAPPGKLDYKASNNDPQTYGSYNKNDDISSASFSINCNFDKSKL